MEIDTALLDPSLAAAVAVGPDEVRFHLAGVAAARGATGSAGPSRAPHPPQARYAGRGAQRAALASFVLVVGAAIALLVGVWERGLALVYVSVLCTVSAALVQAGARIQRSWDARRRSGPSTGPGARR